MNRRRSRREGSVIEIGISLDDRLGQIFRHEDDDDRRDERFGQHRPALRHGVPAGQLDLRADHAAAVGVHHEVVLRERGQRADGGAAGSIPAPLISS